jgi:hypothetical protein
VNPSIRLGFLGSRPFRCKGPILGVGFPWISLDSLVRIETFQWVTRIFAERKFLAPFPPGERRGGTEACGRSHSEAQACSWGKLNPVSVFLQAVVVRAGRFRPRHRFTSAAADRALFDAQPRALNGRGRRT